MAQSKDVKAFKNELRNYTYNCYRIETLQNSIDFCYHRLGADARAIDYSKEPNHSTPNKELEYKLRDDIEYYSHLQAQFQAKVDYVDLILANIEEETRNAIKSVYIEGKQMRLICSRMYLSLGALQKRINKAIERALK